MLPFIQTRVYDTDRDGLSDSTEYYETFTNASDRDTDSDGLEDFTEAVDGFMWNGSVYFTNASMFDTDNDGLNDGEEVSMVKTSTSLTQIMQILMMMDFQMEERSCIFLDLGNLQQIHWTMIPMTMANRMVGRCRYFQYSRIQIPTVFG